MLLRLCLATCLFLLAACAGSNPSSAPAAPSPETEPPIAADRAPESGAKPDAPAQVEGEVDYACSVDADCTVKNVGNCCGYYPACVNVDSPTFPEQVQARCAREGLSSVCGFPEIRGCRCVDGRCEAKASGLEAQLQVD